MQNPVANRIARTFQFGDTEHEGQALTTKLFLQRISHLKRNEITMMGLFVVWATGHWRIGECAIVFQASGYMLTLSFLVSVLSFSDQEPSHQIRCPSYDL